MDHTRILDHLDHTFAVELDRRRRIRWVNRAVATIEGQDQSSYRGCRPEDLWPVREECVRAFHDCLRRQEVLKGYEVWTGRGDVQRIVQVTRIPSRSGVVIVGEDVTDANRAIALWALLDAITDTAPRLSIAPEFLPLLASRSSVRRIADVTTWPVEVVVGNLWRLCGRA